MISYILMPLPPLRSLLAFEAIVRHGSVSRAAAELGVSQPAVSQQLRVIERHFGRRMLERTGAGLRMEADVELYAAKLRSAIESIRSASQTLHERSAEIDKQLTVSVLATFAQCWLIPRLAGFQQRFPDIDVRLLTTSRPIDLIRDDVDLSIRCGNGEWLHHSSQFLVANRVFPVASAAYLQNRPIRSVDDLRSAVLIRVDAPPRNRDWSIWLTAAQADALRPRAWQTYSTSTQALEAATAGMGIAMAHTPFVIDSLNSGRLISPFTQACPDADGDYYLVSREQRDIATRVHLFQDWFASSSGQT